MVVMCCIILNLQHPKKHLTPADDTYEVDRYRTVLLIPISLQHYSIYWHFCQSLKKKSSKRFKTAITFRLPAPPHPACQRKFWCILRRHCCDLLSPIIATFPSYVLAYVTVLFERACCRYVEPDLPVCVWDRMWENLYWLLITVFGWMDRQMCRKLKSYEPKWLAWRRLFPAYIDLL